MPDNMALIPTPTGRVNILGKGIGWEDAPAIWENKGPCWGVNDLILWRPLHAVFEMHDLEWTDEELYYHQKLHLQKWYPEEVIQDKVKRKRRKWQAVVGLVNRHRTPYISVKTYTFIHNSIGFPLKEVVDKYKSDYFATGISYMIAYAVYQGFKDIHLYGVAMIAPAEYTEQRGAVQHWVGIAMGSGAKVKVHGRSAVQC